MKKGQTGIGINDIGPIALSVGIAVIVVAVVALILTQFLSASYVDYTVTNKTFDNTTTLTIGVDGLVSWAVYNDTTQVYDALTRNNNYTLYTNNGTLIVNGSAAETGTESVNYVYSSNSNATIVTARGVDAIVSFADWFIIIVIVVVSVIVLSMVMLLRGRGGGKS